MPYSRVTRTAYGADAIQYARGTGKGHNAPDCQSAVFAQTDGVGHKLHLHIVTNDVKITNFRGLEHSARHHSEFSRIVDRICAWYIDSKPLERSPEHVTQAVRGQRAVNEKIRAANEEEEQMAALEGREPDLIAEKYIWIDDLRERVKRAAAGAKR